MPQSLARNVIHLIYSNKNREPFIAPAVRDDLFKYLAGTFKGAKLHPNHDRRRLRSCASSFLFGQDLVAEQTG